MANGIVTLAGSRLYTSMADTPEIIDDALNRFEEVFKHVQKTNKGMLKKRPRSGPLFDLFTKRATNGRPKAFPREGFRCGGDGPMRESAPTWCEGKSRKGRTGASAPTLYQLLVKW